MDHGAVIRSHATVLGRLVLLLVLVAMLLAVPATARAAGATLVEPADGHHFDHLERAPMVQFDPSKAADGRQENPKWVLLATDAGMKTTVRYCRQFVWAMSNGAYHWGCNRWATGVDQQGNDRLLALEPGKVYFWQVVSSGADGTGEVKSAVRAFAIDAEGAQNTVQDISGQVVGTAVDDGSYLNLGAAAFVNSKVRVSTLASTRIAPTAYRIRLTHVGDVDYSRSYVKVTSRAGTRYLRIARIGTELSAGTVWRLNAAERRLGTKRFQYQAFLKSRTNGSLVRSKLRVVYIRSTARPNWTPDRTTVDPV